MSWPLFCPLWQKLWTVIKNAAWCLWLLITHCFTAIILWHMKWGATWNHRSDCLTPLVVLLELTEGWWEIGGSPRVERGTHMRNLQLEKGRSARRKTLRQSSTISWSKQCWEEQGIMWDHSWYRKNIMIHTDANLMLPMLMLSEFLYLK